MSIYSGAGAQPRLENSSHGSRERAERKEEMGPQQAEAVCTMEEAESIECVQDEHTDGKTKASVLAYTERFWKQPTV